MKNSENSRKALARWGENLAAQFLEEHGYAILDKNARTQYGEIDLVSCYRDPNTQEYSIVFVEVKTRSSASLAYPEASVTEKKKAHIIAAISAYMQAHPEITSDWRIDVIAIQRSPSGQPPVIDHFENAFT